MRVFALGLLAVAAAAASCSGPPAPAKPAAAPVPSDPVLARGHEVYRGTCRKCHENGLEGATKIADRDTWKEKLEQKGLDTLTAGAIGGFDGKWGEMPPRGGNDALTDDDVRAAVRYLAEDGGRR